MKTITTTYYFGTNYGATLQAYALQQTIKSLGHENEILDIVSVPEKAKGDFSPIQLIKKWYIRYLSFKRRRQCAILRQHFADFHKRYMEFTRKYASMDELRSDPKSLEYDCLITGSDQVWNLRTKPDFVDSRLLLFGSKSSRRFSYAASLEELNYTEEQKDRVKEALRHFNGISLREESARVYIESFTGLKCERIIDPVFLLSKEDWTKLARNPRIQGPYILCYQVLRNTRMEEVAYRLKEATGYPIVSICNSSIRWIRADYTFFDVSIEEFLGFYSHAAFIVSASFHGVAMGLVFEKPVYAMVKNIRADRIRNLMNIMNLQSYIVVQDTKDEIVEYDRVKIEQMKAIIEEEREKGIDFLRKMLS